MKKSKKWFAVVVAGALMASVLAGCSVDEKTSESGTAQEETNQGDGEGTVTKSDKEGSFKIGIAVETYLTDCFVAVYIGTLISDRNKFNIIGSVIGALFVGFTSNFITLMGMGIAYKNIFNGIFIILAVALGVLKSRTQS